MNQPNVLFLMVDQLHYGDLGYMGHPVVKTPHLDQLEKDALHFKRYYVQNAFCLPSRTCYLTGQYLFHHRQYGFTGLLDEGSPCLPKHFQANGYETYHVGKLHVNSFGEHIGFDTLIPTLPEDICQSTDMQKNFQVYCETEGFGYPTDQIHGDDHRFPAIGAQLEEFGFVGCSNIPADKSLERYTADQAIEFIKADHQKPFFANVSFDRPHGPWTPSPEYADMYPWQDIPLPPELDDDDLASMPEHIQKIVENSKFSIKQSGKETMQKILAYYYALISHIDDEIGRVLTALKEKKLYDNTVIVFCADHGDMAGHKGLFDKYSNKVYHDDIIRSPLLLKLPEQKHKGEGISRLTESIDLFPTLCDLCSIAADGLALDGDSLLNIIEDPERRDWRNAAFSESYALKTLVTDQYKLIYYVNSDEGELYDLKADPREHINLYRDPNYQHKVAEMKQAIICHMTEPVSEQRQNYIRSLFDDQLTRPLEAMDKIYKWDKGIIEGGGFWMLFRDNYRLTLIPFDDELRLEKKSDKPHNGYTQEYDPVDEPAMVQACLDELINYLATKIRPISLMTGSVEEQDNMRQTKGQGFC